MTTTAHIEEIKTTRVGGFGGSDAAMFYRIGLKGLSALTNSDKKRIRVAKGIDEYKPIFVNEAMKRGHYFEDWYAENAAMSSLVRERKFTRTMARHFDTFFHADFSNDKIIYELKCVNDTENVEDKYFQQLQWQHMIAPVGMKVYLEVFDSSKEFDIENLQEPTLIERAEMTIEILRMGIQLLDENWDTLDLEVGEEWNESDLMPFERNDINVFTSYLQRIQQLEALAEESKQKVFQFMKDNNIKSLKSDFYTVTFVPESTKSTLDKKKLFTEHPEINELDYLKTSPKKAYITVKLK